MGFLRLAGLDCSAASKPVKDMISKIRWTALETCHPELTSALHSAHIQVHLNMYEYTHACMWACRQYTAVVT